MKKLAAQQHSGSVWHRPKALGPVLQPGPHGIHRAVFKFSFENYSDNFKRLINIQISHAGHPTLYGAQSASVNPQSQDLIIEP
jgi:hypothetical protein